MPVTTTLPSYTTLSSPRPAMSWRSSITTTSSMAPDRLGSWRMPFSNTCSRQPTRLGLAYNASAALAARSFLKTSTSLSTLRVWSSKLADRA